MHIENNTHFTSEMVEGKLRIKKKTYNSSYGFVRPFAIDAGRTTRLTIKQIKISDQNIMYGISTDKTKGMHNPYNHAECKFYYARNGRVYYNGTYRTVGTAIHDGSIVTMVADLLKWRIAW